ncbi:MAG: Zn-ribbon domain-containing OB-fold protein [Nitrososphaerales archaeon]
MAISYWRRRDRYYRLLGNKCTTCNAEYYPPVYICRRCGSESLIDAEMPGTGKILTYTILREVMSGFEGQQPIIIGIVQLDNGVKVLGQIVDTPLDALKIGCKVRTVFRKIREESSAGQIYYGYKFTVLC